MTRPRIVHRTRAVDQRQVLHTPPRLPAPLIADADPYAASGGAPTLTAVNGGGVMHQVQMENVHPLRLRILLEIDRAGSISAAAERCGIGQPSASMHLRTLETAIGQRLVIRNGRGSRLTTAGKIVASHAARILATLDNMRWALDAANAPNRGELTLAASYAPSLVLIPPLLRQFSERYPGVTVNVRTLPSSLVVREVARGAADIGIAGDVPSSEPVVREQLMVDELVGIAAAGLLSSSNGSVSRSEFARNSLLLGRDGSGTRLITERHLARAECRPARIWAFDSAEAMKRAVAGGLGVSFMSRLLVRNEIERGELVPFHVSGVETMARPIHAVQRSLAELTPHAADFTMLLIDAHREPAAAQQLG